MDTRPFTNMLNDLVTLDEETGISPISPLYLPYTSPISPYISPVSPLYLLVTLDEETGERANP